MKRTAFDVGLSYVVEHSDGTREVARNYYVHTTEASDEEHSLVVAQQRLTAHLLDEGRLKEGDTLRIFSGSTQACTD
jgi:hypothetical protein